MFYIYVWNLFRVDSTYDVRWRVTLFLLICKYSVLVEDTVILLSTECVPSQSADCVLFLPSLSFLCLPPDLCVDHFSVLWCTEYHSFTKSLESRKMCPLPSCFLSESFWLPWFLCSLCVRITMAMFTKVCARLLLNP